MTDGRQIFLDPSGRRRARLRGLALAVGVITTIAAVVVVSSVLVPPLLPDLPLTQTAADSLGRVPRTAKPRVHRIVSPQVERERLRIRQRLFEQLAKRPAPPSRHLVYRRGGLRAPKPLEPGADRIVAGFYVNWDDNSFASLRQHIAQLDWVVAEWGFVGRDPKVPIRFDVDKRVLALAQQQAEPPRILAMLTNYTGQDFSAAAVDKILRVPARRREAIDSTLAVLDRLQLGGVMVDFEQLPPRMHEPLIGFLKELRAAFQPKGYVLAQAIPGDDDTWPLAKYAEVDDRIVLMLYDEHDGTDEPGPIASDAWFRYHLARALREVPANKLIAGLGQYGYVWSDTTETAGELTFQDVMQLARDKAVAPALEPTTGNPTFQWRDPDSTGHIAWYLDAVTAFNQVRHARASGLGGVAIWRLGEEDPSIWSVLDRRGRAERPHALDSIRIGYDVEFDGTGEILRLVSEPHIGRRTITVDSATGLITGERVLEVPSTYRIKRYGRKKGVVALTFDDGPDPEWTPQILDTLRSRGVHGTFFLIGENAEVYPELVRRLLREGHELGNHTFTHPNMALVGPRTMRLELSATERLLEAITNRETALFRPPYFGDAEPTTADELVPIAYAQSLGYITVGLRIDPDDWATPGVDSIIQRTLAQLNQGNVVLLHDGGGDRAQTVAALGPLIDSLRGRGLRLTTVTELAGVTRDEAMPPVEGVNAFRRFVELGSFTAVGWIELMLRALFVVVMVLGIGRLAVITSLALWHRFRRRAPSPGAYCPHVSVIVPAYREEVVIVRTVESILAQDYGSLEVLVVDDGSPDTTYDVCVAAFAGNPKVRLFRKENGGKASALNYGLQRAMGDVVVAVDADTLFPPNAITALVAPLADPDVAAVAGDAKVGNRVNLVTRWQAIEYITSQNLDRRAFALLDCITVVPGAIGAWRRQRVLDAGGFSDATLAEDQDLTMTLLRQGGRIAYADHAIAWTEAPATIGALARQRFRWSFGTLQCVWKHRGALFNPKARTLGFIGLPNVWIFQIFFAILSPIADLLFLWSLVTVWLNQRMHGSEYAMQSLRDVVTFYAIFLFVDWFAAVVAVLMEPDEEKGLAWLVLLQRFVYRQLIYGTVIRALAAALTGRARGWGKLERKGTVELRT